MPIKTTIKAGIIYIDLTGIIDYDIVIKQIDYSYSLKDKIVNRYELHDHTKTEGLDLSADDIRKIAAYGIKTKGIFENSFLAVYAPTDNTFGIARMFETFYELEGHSMHVKIFRDRAQALQYLVENQRNFG